MPDFVFSNDAVRDEDKISGIRVEIRGDGRSARFSWQWPKSMEYAYCCMYYLPENEALEVLMDGHFRERTDLPGLFRNKEPEIVSRYYPRELNKTLSSGSPLYGVAFPAKMSSEGSYILARQMEGNISSCIKLRPTICVSVRIEKQRKMGFLWFKRSNERQAHIHIRGDEPPLGSCLIYQCGLPGRNAAKYGIDLSGFYNRTLCVTLQGMEDINFIEPSDKSYILKVDKSREK